MLTIVYTYYNQSERIADIIKEKHPDCKVIIVDDCSEKPLNINCPGIEVYRILDDIKWNQGGARNLGAQQSEDWIIFSDIDHLVTYQNVQTIIDMKKEIGSIYYLGRTNANTDPLNIFLIHKSDFEKIGGYDEDFSGHYGYEDVLFRYQCHKQLQVVEKCDIQLINFSDESHTKNLSRD